MTEFKPSRAVWLIARREILTRVRRKAFVIGTVVVLAVIAGYVLFLRFVADQGSTTTVAVTPDAAAVSAPLTQAGEAIGRKIVIRDVPDVAAGEQAVRDGDADALLTGGFGETRLVGREEVPGILLSLVNDVLRSQALDAQFDLAGLDPADVTAAIQAAAPEVNTLEPSDPQRGQRLVLGIGVVALLYGSLLFVGQLVAQGVVEEKASRVVELLLSTVRPWQLLLGKVLGLGAVGLLQLLIIGGLGLGVSTALDVLTLPGAVASTLATGLLWYLIGLLLYATAYAAAASLVSRQEDLPAVVTPMTMVIVIAFVFGINMLIADRSSTAVTVLSMLPPFSPILMPGRMALGIAPFWQVALAVALAALAILGLTWLAGRIYSRAVLRTGARVKLRDALRST
jgi:ABC-2 type transport system permease protein